MPNDHDYTRGVSVRLRESTLKRADRLAALVDMPDLAALVPRGLTRHAILRLAIQRGLDELEREFGGDEK